MTTFRIAIALLAIATPVTAQDSASVGKQFEAQYARFSQAYVTLDPDAVANLYTDDAYYMSPGVDIKRGRATIRSDFAGFFDSVRSRGDSVRIAFTILDRRISGALATDIGYYDLTGKARSGESRTDRGKFVVIWVRGTDGAWRIRTDAYSSITPPRAPQ